MQHLITLYNPNENVKKEKEDTIWLRLLHILIL